MIEQDDVPIAVNACEDRCHGNVERGGRHTRAASDDKEGIGLLAAVDRRHPRERQADVPAAGNRRVLGHHQLPAIRRDEAQVLRVLKLAGG